MGYLLVASFKPSKCEALLISKKRNPVKASYVLGESFVPWKPVVRYSWSFHQFCTVMVMQITAAKVSRSLNYLRHSLWGATHSAKASANVSLVRPLLEYACTAWNPHTCKDQLPLEQVQLRAAR